ncbi:MAG TPA: 3-deoxy-D-manno-octulosonic acid transferase, partial [Candidatus Aminicenantes bacterium]|nr:3-deoxy-D-manno-octulosonic acid transferase [Candidatus Aminicenantes bacterium]
MYVFYSFLLLISFLIYIPVNFVRIKLLRRESFFLRDRLGRGLNDNCAKKQSLWIHAVSVGEVISLQNLIKKIKEKHPAWTIHFSTLTNTGMRVAKEKLTDADNIFFVPLDFKYVVRKYFNTLRPRVFVLAESELWPNLLREAKRQTKGVLLINGRISSRSFKRYSRFKFVAKKILKNIDLFLVQTEKDKENFEKIGVNSGVVEVVKNLKSEVNLPILTEEDLLKLKSNLSIPATNKVIVAGSTRKGEEKELIEAYSRAKSVKENLLLILAPRHPERFDEVERICQDFPFKVMRRTQVSPNKQWDILILDTIGELAHFYALSDVSFVGGSLVPWGGQNLLEPAFYKKPIFFGPHMDNFAFLAEKFVQSGAARIINKNKDLDEMFLIRDEESLKKMGRSAKETLNSLQGATEKTIKA